MFNNYSFFTVGSTNKTLLSLSFDSGSPLSKGNGPVTFTCANDRTWIDSSRTIRKAYVNEYALSGVRWAGENLWQETEDLSNTPWIKTNVTSNSANDITVNGINLCRATANGTYVANIYNFKQNPLEGYRAGQAYEVSCYVYADEITQMRILIHDGTNFYNGQFDVSTGTVLGSSDADDQGIEDVGGGVYRVWIHHTIDSVSGSNGLWLGMMENGNFVFDNDASKGIYYGQMQVTKIDTIGQDLSPYVKTETYLRNATSTADSAGRALYADIASFDKVLCVGDSFGNDANEFPDQLDALIPGTVTNNCVAGSWLTTGGAESVERDFQTNLDADNFNVVVIQGGYNDIQNSVAQADMQTSIQNMVTYARSQGVEVLVCGISPWRAKSAITDATWNTWLETYCAGVAGATYIDIYTPPDDPVTTTYLHTPYDSGDGLHPSLDGSKAIARAIHDQGFSFIRGALLEEARTNLCENYNANPTDTTGITKTGDAAATLSVVDDTTNLNEAGLGWLCHTGKAYKLDNSGGAAIASAEITGNPGNTNAHTYSVYARLHSTTGNGSLSDANRTSPTTFVNSYYESVVHEIAAASADATGKLSVNADAGAVVYFVLNQLEEGAFATSPIIVTGGVGGVARAVTACSIPAAGNTKTDFTAFIEVYPQGDGADYANNDFRLITGNDARGANNSIQTVGGAAYDFTVTGGAPIFTFLKTDFSANQQYKISFSAQQAGANVIGKIFVNGVKKHDETVAGTLDHSADNNLNFCQYPIDSTYFSAVCKAVKVYRRALSDGQQTGITS